VIGFVSCAENRKRECRREEGLTMTEQKIVQGSSARTIDRTKTDDEYICELFSLWKIILAMSKRGSTCERIKDGKMVTWKTTKIRY
jgi:hypothetical protein